jgi:hypothetical protein
MSSLLGFEGADIRHGGRRIVRVRLNGDHPRLEELATGGGIRQQFGSELNVRLSQLSAETWDGFEELFGARRAYGPGSTRLGRAVSLDARFVTRSSARSPTDSTSRWASQGPASCTLQPRGDWRPN